MARQMLVVGLDSGTPREYAEMIQQALREKHPGLEVTVIAGCTDLAVVELPEEPEDGS